MKRRTWVGGILLAITFVALGLYAQRISMFLFEREGRIQEERYLTSCARQNLDVVKRMRQVSYVGIFLDVNHNGPSVELTAARDRVYIDAIMRSIRRMEVVHSTSPFEDATDTILVGRLGHCKPVEGHLDPDREPVVSPTLRSADLAKIVYGIFRAKGVKPYHQKIPPRGY